jgi:hypothetical protein
MLVVLMIICGAITAEAQTARLQMSQLDSLARKASETTDLNVDERLIQLTIKWLGDDPDDKEIKKIVSGLKGIYVRSFEFENPGEYSEVDVESIRSQVRNSNWSKVLDAKSKKEGSIEVYIMTAGSQIGGLVVLANEPKEFTVVNVVGPVDLEKLTKLDGHFGLPDLDIETTPKPKQKN